MHCGCGCLGGVFLEKTAPRQIEMFHDWIKVISQKNWELVWDKWTQAKWTPNGIQNHHCFPFNLSPAYKYCFEVWVSHFCTIHWKEDFVSTHKLRYKRNSIFIAAVNLHSALISCCSMLTKWWWSSAGRGAGQEFIIDLTASKAAHI